MGVEINQLFIVIIKVTWYVTNLPDCGTMYYKYDVKLFLKIKYVKQSTNLIQFPQTILDYAYLQYHVI